jgi:alpha,alpha-trehalose phosphorylase
MDLNNLQDNTRDGVHVASLAGAWIALVAGFGGMRDHDGVLSFAPRLPDALQRLSFRLHWRGQTVSVTVNHDRVSYTVLEGVPVDIVHYGQKVRLAHGAPAVYEIPPVQPGPQPTQPPGRAPRRRTPNSHPTAPAPASPQFADQGKVGGP